MTIFNYCDAGDEGFTIRFDYDGSNKVIRKGKAVPGKAYADTAWSIQLFEYTGNNVTAIKVPAGTIPGVYTAKWSDRESLEYI